MAINAAVGVDIGGSGIKGAPVDLGKGDFAAERVRIETPSPSTPENVAEVVRQVVEQAGADLPPETPVGVTIPAPVLHGVLPFMANLDQAWEGIDADAFLTDALQRPVFLVNDADAAGLAEVRYGAAKDVDGMVLLTTLGTGIGSAMILDGVLVPNTELGHLVLPNGKEAEKWAASSVKEKKQLSYKEWAARLQVYYEHLEMLFSPDLFLVGGGVSKNAEKFLPHLKLRAPIKAATLQNRAGIVGAAAWAAQHS